MRYNLFFTGAMMLVLVLEIIYTHAIQKLMRKEVSNLAHLTLGVLCNSNQTEISDS